jgi:hypothetical protein
MFSGEDQALSLDGKKWLRNKQEVLCEAVKIYRILKEMGVTVQGLGKRSAPTTLFFPFQGLSTARPGMVARPISKVADQYVFSRGSSEGLAVRVREYKKNPRNGAISVLQDDMNFLHANLAE